MSTPARKTDYPIDPIVLERWSTRAFDGSPINDRDLFTMFEAARWAPSSFNRQPWRFVYAKRGTEAFDRFLKLLMPFNAGWAAHASVLVFILSDTLIQLPGTDSPSISHSHSFDAGAAWAFLALQATKLGYHTHGMAGVDFGRARAILGVPDEFRLETAVAIGKLGDASRLPPHLRERETPSGRRPLSETVCEERYGWSPTPPPSDRAMP
jgi:nitroreductase